MKIVIRTRRTVIPSGTTVIPSAARDLSCCPKDPSGFALGMTTVLVGLLAASSVMAANGIDVRRGEDTLLFGSCVPSLVVENRSAETIDFLQVDLTVVLSDGQQRTVPLQSAYREGVHYPIAPGGKAILKQPLDLSRSLGVACADVKSRTVARTICEASGKACSSAVTVQP
jgi:hypothetical protein